MRFNSSHAGFVLLSAIVLCGCSGASAPTNQIAHLLSTNRPGQYRLEPAWVGALTQTVATGFYATHTNTPAQDSWERKLRFDLFNCFEKPSALGIGPRVVSQILDRTADGWSETRLYSYRDTFPTDSELTKAHTMAALTNLLGLPQGSQSLHSVDGWAFFRFNDDTTLEALSVHCLTRHTNGQADTYVDSIRIRRGVARQER